MQFGAISPVTLNVPEVLETRWRAVERCPACGSGGARFRAALPDRHYAFGEERVALPEPGISVVGCNDCGLAYKSAVPAPAFLAGVFRRQSAAKWMDTHDYSGEVERLRELAGGAAFDLIDVGAAGGELLKACAAAGIAGRRSVLDVMRFPGVGQHIAGEFIEGFLDAPALEWSGAPYDVATLFDVLEHLYQPQAAFVNLRALVKTNGLVLIETGDSGSAWPQQFGINHWWYVRLLEHHVFWSRRSLAHIAARHGFEIVSWDIGRHKSRRELGAAAIGRDWLKAGFYRLAPRAYRPVAALLGREGSQPWHPYAMDHFTACLRKM